MPAPLSLKTWALNYPGWTHDLCARSARRPSHCIMFAQTSIVVSLQTRSIRAMRYTYFILDLYIIGCSKLWSIRWLWGCWSLISYNIAGTATARINKPIIQDVHTRKTVLGIKILGKYLSFMLWHAPSWKLRWSLCSCMDSSGYHFFRLHYCLSFKAGVAKIHAFKKQATFASESSVR